MRSALVVVAARTPGAPSDYGHLRNLAVLASLAIGGETFVQILEEYADKPAGTGHSLDELLSVGGSLKTTCESLHRALQHEDERIAMWAPMACGQHRMLECLEPLLAALQQQSLIVRTTAAWALGQLRHPRAVVPLLRAVQTLELDPQAKRIMYGALSRCLFRLKNSSRE